ncbi:dihydroneopterin aldolase [Salininema proteolyticum]|uniref:7,8-dihydroneopterin aldolase n=1 Tax=Salininema proteolyticum TaxID=1607685 RepID=A0ABV8U3F2_9ACTN
MSADVISLKGLRVFGYHGVYETERSAGQEFLIDADLHVSTAKAAASDDVADTVHYGDLADRMVAVVAGEPVALIETLAERLAALCLEEAGVERAAVTVHKPDAPIRHQFSDVSVRIERSR